jgi:hypothetical protein
VPEFRDRRERAFLNHRRLDQAAGVSALALPSSWVSAHRVSTDRSLRSLLDHLLRTRERYGAATASG